MPSSASVFQAARGHFAAREWGHAAHAFKAALADSPEAAAIYSNLATVEGLRGLTTIACALMERAVQIEASFPELHYNLGNMRLAVGDGEGAARAYRAAVALRPLYAQAQNNLGECLIGAGETEAAKRALAAACCVDPGLLAPLLNLGALENELGDEARAVALFDRVLRADPANSRAWYNRSLAVKATPEDDMMPLMERLAAILPPEKAEDRILLSFALGKGWSELGNPEKAFHYFAQGNSLQRARYDYAVKTDTAHMRTIAEAFPQEKVSRTTDPAALPPRMIFVVGMPRSGTTLVEQILSTHSRIHGAGELTHFNRLMEEHFPKGRGLADASREELRSLGKLYRERAARDAGAADLMIDKLPANLLHAGVIAASLPDAVIIRCRRDPIDTCWSCFSHHFSQLQPFAYDLADLGAYCRATEELAAHWRRVLPQRRYTEIAYEELIGDPRKEVARLLEFCGVEWEEDCLQFHANSRQVRTASLAQVRQPLYRAAIGKARLFAPFLAPLQEALAKPHHPC